MNNLDYGKVFEVLVKETANYVKVNNLKAMVLGYECDTDRDSAMTTFSDVDIAFLRGKSKWKSGTAENILRRYNMSSN